MTSEDLNIEEKVEQYIQKESYHKGLKYSYRLLVQYKKPR